MEDISLMTPQEREDFIAKDNFRTAKLVKSGLVFSIVAVVVNILVLLSIIIHQAND